MIDFRHIAVEGVPGAGKTGTAAALSKRIGAKLVLDVDENPFLPEFHADMESRSFQTQIFFLLSRYGLESELRQPELFDAGIVTDYFFDRDAIYASLTLDEAEMTLYRSIFALLGARRTLPDLVVFLQLSVAEARRRKPDIEPAFMKLLTDAYNDYFFAWSGTPLLVVQADHFSPASNDEDMEELVRAIEAQGPVSRTVHLAAGGRIRQDKR
ncbi:MAG: deoxynucleoside kinase [Candidatus Hydrogenedentota bacterium]